MAHQLVHFLLLALNLPVVQDDERSSVRNRHPEDLAVRDFHVLAAHEQFPFQRALVIRS